MNALNADLPYDRFLMLQIAGDDIAPGDRDALIATGFCRCGPRELVGGNVIPEVKRQSELTEITGTVGSVFLGMTIGCAAATTTSSTRSRRPTITGFKRSSPRRN